MLKVCEKTKKSNKFDFHVNRCGENDSTFLTCKRGDLMRFS